MDTNRIARTSNNLSRALTRVRSTLGAVPRSADDQREALSLVRDCTLDVWGAWVEHCDSFDEAISAVTYALGDGVEEVSDVAYYADAEFDALRTLEREVQLAARDTEAGYSVDRGRLIELYQTAAEKDEMRQLAERRVIRAYGAIVFVADTW